jgi:HD superfamily phosphodiesterase
MSDHSWVHIQIVTNIALRLARLLFRRGVVPGLVADYGLGSRDAEVAIAAAALFHDTGLSIHRTDHEAYSLFLTADKLGDLLSGIYAEPERSVIVAEAMHAVISHRSRGNPFTIEGAIVRVADALDMAKGRSRVPFEAGHTNIHSVSAYAIDEVRISAGREKAVRVEIDMNNSAGGCSRSPIASSSTATGGGRSRLPRGVDSRWPRWSSRTRTSSASTRRRAGPTSPSSWRAGCRPTSSRPSRPESSTNAPTPPSPATSAAPR